MRTAIAGRGFRPSNRAGSATSADPARLRELLAARRPASLTKAGPPAKWYEVKNVSGGRAEIFIYDEIGYWGTTADDFVRELSQLDVDAIDLRLNTPGGDAWDGIAIYNALRVHKATVNVYVDALAASAGSIIAMAGSKIIMRRASRMMIHKASGMAWGNADVMREFADLLDGLDEDIASTYVARAGGTRDEWLQRMAAETWYSGPEAVAAGLADEADPERDPQPEPDDSVVPGDDDVAEDADPLAKYAAAMTTALRGASQQTRAVTEVKINAEAIRTALRGAVA